MLVYQRVFTYWQFRLRAFVHTEHTSGPWSGLFGYGKCWMHQTYWNSMEIGIVHTHQKKTNVFVQTSMILWFQACLKPVLTFHVIIICSTWGLFTKIIQNRCLARGVAKILAAFRWSLAACRRPRAGVWDQEPTQSTLSDRCTLTLKYRM